MKHSLKMIKIRKSVFAVAGFGTGLREQQEIATFGGGD